MAKVVVFGGSGFLGKRLIENLKNRFEKVVSASMHAFEYPGVDCRRIDVLDRDSVENIIKDVDIVINCTGQITYPITQCLKINTEGIDNIIAAVSQWDKRLIHISSVAVYGDVKEAKESDELNPMTAYAAVKATAEYLISKGLDASKYTIIRLSNLYGDAQEKGIIAYLMRSYVNDKKLEFNNNGSLKRDFLHIEDCVATLADIACNEAISGTYNFAGNEHFSIKELIALFEKVSQSKFNVSYEDVEPFVKDPRIDDSALKKQMTVEYKNNMENFFKQFLQKQLR